MPQNRGNSGRVNAGVALEVVAFSVLVIFIILLLNFMNILRLGFYFPALSFLPHMAVQPVVKVNPYQKPIVHQYDQSIPEKALPEFLKNVVKKEFLPQSFTIVHNLNENSQTTDTDYTYGTTWTTGNAQFHGFYHFNLNSNKQQDNQLEVMLYPSSAKTTDAKALISQYLNTDGSKANCKVLDANVGLTICEVFYADFFGVKHGFGAVINIVDPNKRHEDLIFACQIPIESIHSDWKSCVEQYATTGIQ